MAVPPWTIELLRRGLGDVARKAREPETLEKIKTQATELLNDLPETAARGIDAMMRSAESGRKSVQRWARKHTTLAIPMLNASGTLANADGSGVPIHQAVAEMGVEFIGGDVMTGNEVVERLDRRAARAWSQSDTGDVGEVATAVAVNLHAAIAAMASATQRSAATIYLHRSHAVRLAGGTLLPDLIRQMADQARVIEVGDADGVRKSDFMDALVGDGPHWVVLADTGPTPVQTIDFGDCVNVHQVVLLPSASCKKLKSADVPSAERLLVDGADLVVMPGDGLAGGPPCGVVVGKRKMLEAIKASATWSILAASPATTAMMVTSIEQSASTQDPLPVESLVLTAAENLKSRAERLATRLSGQDSIVSARVSDAPARFIPDGQRTIASRQVRVRHRSLAASDWANQLKQDVPAILAGVDGEELVLDLRWIAAADDGKLAEALGAESSEVQASTVQPNEVHLDTTSDSSQTSS